MSVDQILLQVGIVWPTILKKKLENSHKNLYF